MNSGMGYKESTIFPKDAVVKKIVMKGDTEFGGVIFYDKKGVKILEAGHLTTLSSKEIGIKSKLLGPPNSSTSPRMEDLVFIIG